MTQANEREGVVDQLSVVLKTWDNRSELDAYVKGISGETLLLGASADHPRKFYSLEVSSEERAVDIGVISSHFGIDLAYTCIDKSLLIGWDNDLAIVDVETSELVVQDLQMGCFYCFDVAGNKLPVVVFELGFALLDQKGSIRDVIHTDDVIEDWAFSESALFVKCMEDGFARYYQLSETAS